MQSKDKNISTDLYIRIKCNKGIVCILSILSHQNSYIKRRKYEIIVIKINSQPIHRFHTSLNIKTSRVPSIPALSQTNHYHNGNNFHLKEPLSSLARHYHRHNRRPRARACPNSSVGERRLRPRILHLARICIYTHNLL